MTRLVTRQKYVGIPNILRGCGSPLPHLPTLVSRLPSPNSRLTTSVFLLPTSASRLSSPDSRLSSTVSHLPSSSPPSPLYPYPFETPTARLRGEVDRRQDDRWVGMDEVGRQQGWRMTAGQKGVSLTASRGGGWLPGGVGGIWPPSMRGGRWPLGGEGGWPPSALEDDHWAGGGEFDHQQEGSRMTARWEGVGLTASICKWTSVSALKQVLKAKKKNDDVWRKTAMMLEKMWQKTQRWRVTCDASINNMTRQQKYDACSALTLHTYAGAHPERFWRILMLYIRFHQSSDFKYEHNLLPYVLHCSVLMHTSILHPSVLHLSVLRPSVLHPSFLILTASFCSAAYLCPAESSFCPAASSCPLGLQV